jgi:hypothetical protein
MGWRFASTEDREAIVGMIADAAEQVPLRLSPPELATSPVAFRRPDGSSVFRPKHSTVFSCETLLTAEDRLVMAAMPCGASPLVATACLRYACSGPTCRSVWTAQGPPVRGLPCTKRLSIAPTPTWLAGG